MSIAYANNKVIGQTGNAMNLQGVLSTILTFDYDSITKFLVGNNDCKVVYDVGVYLYILCRKCNVGQ